MNKVRKYSVLNNPDPQNLQAYRGLDARRISRSDNRMIDNRTENKNRAISLNKQQKVDSLKSNNSLKS